jgi:alkaline phosphatase
LIKKGYIYVWLIALLIAALGTNAQQRKYSTANAHSHNDYQQRIPFHNAWNHRFGSIEADIYLYKGKLVVAHDSSQLARQWSLDSLYLRPLQKCIENNKGNVYADPDRSLQLMIDIKSEAVSTLDLLTQMLRTYPSLIRAASLKIVISGSRPAASQFASYPSWILFDGELRKEYQPQELAKIEMLSDNFARYSSWKGKGEIPEKDKQALQQQIDKAHQLGKKIRFWNAPDVPEAWNFFMQMGVDYINTDHIDGLGEYLNAK